MKFLAEMKKRSVFRAAIAYLAIAWLLVQVAETVLEPFGIGDDVLRIIIIIAIIGFVPTVVFAWFFEVTAKGLRRESEVDHETAAAGRADSVLNRVIIVMLGLAVTYFAVDKFLLDRSVADNAPSAVQLAIERYGDRSLVVLPFANIGAIAAETSLGDSLAAELQGLLAEIRDWRIISRTTAVAIQDQKYSIARIADELDVRYVVEGSVRRDAGGLAVDVALIDAASDLAVWTERYERPLAEIFDVQDEVVRHIVERLQISILGEVPMSRRVQPEAYVRFMQARQMLDEPSPAYDRVSGLLEEALAIDPDYPEALTARSWLYWRYRVEKSPGKFAVFRGITAAEAARRCAADLARALELDPDNAIASAYRGWELGMDAAEFASAAVWFERALALGPQHSDVIRTSTAFANRIRRHDAAVRIGEFGLVRDPLCSRCQWNLKDAYLAAGQYAEAENLMRNLASPETGGYLSLGLTQLQQGRYEEALATFELQVPQDNYAAEVLMYRGMAYFSLGEVEKADAAVVELESLRAENTEYAWETMRLHAWRGDAPAALRAFDALLGKYDPNRLARWIVSDVIALKLENQPPVQRLLREQGLARDKLGKIRFEFSLPSA